MSAETVVMTDGLKLFNVAENDRELVKLLQTENKKLRDKVQVAERHQKAELQRASRALDKRDKAEELCSAHKRALFAVLGALPHDELVMLAVQDDEIVRNCAVTELNFRKLPKEVLS